jgi:hypothetical protein
MAATMFSRPRSARFRVDGWGISERSRPGRLILLRLKTVTAPSWSHNLEFFKNYVDIGNFPVMILF